MKLDIKRLIEIAKQNKHLLKKKPKENFENEAMRFIVTLKIKAGAHKVSEDLIYEAYTIWCAEPATKESFIKRFSIMIEPTLEKKKRFFNINYKPIQLINKVDQLKGTHE